MNSAAFLSAVKQEIARLQQIQSLLENESTNATPDSARKPISEKRGGMTEAGKARVAEAQRKRWAVKKAAAEAESAAAKKQTAASTKKSAKTVAAVQPAKKQRASASKPATGKTAKTAKKAPVKKSIAATKPTAGKKATTAKKNSAGQAAPKKASSKQPELNTRVDAAEANASTINPAVTTEDSSSTD